MTKRFDGVPLPEALDRILGRQNFAVRYDADGHPVVVELYGTPLPRVTTNAGRATVANFLALLGKAPPVALSPALRQALRTPTARPAQLMAAVRQADAAVRIEARRAFLSAVEGNAALSATLSRADPNSITPLVRSLPADRADELFSDLGLRSRDPVLRGLFLRTKRALQQERAAQSARSQQLIGAARAPR